MKNIILRMVGDQAWGIHMRTENRMCSNGPTKSGAIGVLAGCLGKKNGLDGKDGLPTIGELAAMPMAVRTDRPGKVVVDFCTAGGGRYDGMNQSFLEVMDKRSPRPYRVTTVEGYKDGPEVTRKFSLQDAAFVIGFRGPDDLINKLAKAAARPKFPPFLGRKQYVPWVPIFACVTDGELLESMRQIPWVIRTMEFLSIGDVGTERLPEEVKYSIECDRSSGQPILDVPTGFDFAKPRYMLTRYVRTEYGPVPDDEYLLSLMGYERMDASCSSAD